MLASFSNDRLVRLDFVDAQSDMSNAMEGNFSGACVDSVRSWIEAYFQGLCPTVDFEFSFAHGTQLQIAVWTELLRIPYGQTRSYLQIAKAVGKPQAVRAVANAIGRNPIAIIVPCHRVIGTSGALTGYAGGLHRKAWMLEMEKDRLF